MTQNDITHLTGKLLQHNDNQDLRWRRRKMTDDINTYMTPMAYDAMLQMKLTPIKMQMKSMPYIMTFHMSSVYVRVLQWAIILYIKYSSLVVKLTLYIHRSTKSGQNKYANMGYTYFYVWWSQLTTNIDIY